MRLFLQQRPVAGEQPKFYQISLEQDLLGGWVLLREWGQPGQRSAAKREVFLDRKDAVSALEKARDSQLKRGFQVMFAQGAEDPRRV
jgi:predicted DNA-binding WGR domain protein